MRATRGFLGALGAGGALIAAAACGLLIVGAMVAENGWPGAASPLDPAKLVANSGPGSNTAAARSAVPTVRVAAPARRPARTSARRHGSQLANRPARGHAPASPRPGVAATPASGAPGSAPSMPASSGGGSGQGGHGGGGNQGSHGGTGTAGSTVQGATQTVANAVSPVSPGAANTVKQTGSSVGGAVDQTTTTVDNAISHLPGVKP